MDSELAQLIEERERMVAYGFARAVKIIDAEIARLMRPASAAPAGRTAPARQTVATPGRKDA